VPNTFNVSGRVLGLSGKHAVYVALWRAEGFLERPVQQVRLEAGAAPIFTRRHRFEITFSRKPDLPVPAGLAGLDPGP
jgi:hypothetical protein